MPKGDGVQDDARGPGRDALAGDALAGEAGAEYRIDIAGDAGGPVVAGDHNLVVDAQHGSRVHVLLAGQRPQPVRRGPVLLPPRRQQQPLGRAAEIEALAGAVRAGGLVQVCGPPGIGTSMLLRHAAAEFAPGPDGAVYLDAASREAGDLAQEVFEACYETAGYAPGEGALRRLMAGVRVTVYIDNADLGRDQMLALADSAPDATFVFASHTASLLSEDGTVLELRGLERDAGLALLARGLQRPLAAHEFAAAHWLWQAAEGRPLHLLRAAGLARLSGGGQPLPLPGAVGDLIPLLLDRLDSASTSVLHLLATLAGAELDGAQIGLISEVPDAAEVCDRLARLGLLLAEEHGYRCAEDTMAAVRGRLPRPFSVDQICRYFTGWAGQSAPELVATYGQALERAAELAQFCDRPDLAVGLARAASPSLARSLRFGAWSRMLGRGWVAARSTGDRRAAAYFTHEEGIRKLVTGRRVLAAVLLTEALALWRELGDAHGVQATLNAQRYAPPMPSGAPAGAHAAGAAHSAGASAAHSAASQSAASHMAGLAHAPAVHAAVPLLPHLTVGAATSATTGAATVGTTTAGIGGTAGGAGAGGTFGTVGVAATSAGGTGAAGSAGTAAFLSAKAALTIAMVLAAGAAAVTLGVHAFSNTDQTSPAPAPVVSSYAPEPTPTPEPTGLDGVWSTQNGPVTVSAAGPDTYTITTNCGDTIELSGQDGEYGGSASLRDDSAGSSCGSVIGTVSMTIELSADGSTAQVSEELPPGETGPDGGTLTCDTCGSFTWTREDQ